MRERFFILGCQRSGTTLMRLILETHPNVFCYDELKSYAVLQGRIPEEASASLIGFKIPRWTEQLTLPVLLDEGPEGPCDNFYKGERLLFLHRDVRDTVASMLKLKAGQSNWCEIWVPQILRAKLANDQCFRARYSAELDIIERNNNRLAGLAALYWKYKNDSFFSYREQGFPILAASYELLVTNPRGALESVCSHLRVPFHENLLVHQRFKHTELFENGLTLGNTDPSRPIQSGSVRQWAKFLVEKDLEIVELIAGDLPGKFAAL